MTFRPDQPMSRLDVAIMLVKGLGLQTLLSAKDVVNQSLAFKDLANLSESQLNYLKIVNGFGLMVGGDGISFRPNDAVTRTEAAVLLVRVLGYEEDAKAIQYPRLSFVDAADIPAWAAPSVQVAVQHGRL
ncbi:S-layer homology domain-containing protein [Effusibacillus dendaii]